MLEQLSIVIKGKEYKFLKPMAINMVELERQAYKNGVFDKCAYEQGLLRMVSKELNRDDFFEFVGNESELSDGTKLKPRQISIKQYEELVGGISERPIEKTINMYFEICGIDKYDISTLTREDIYKILQECNNIYASSELDEVVDKLANFC